MIVHYGQYGGVILINIFGDKDFGHNSSYNTMKITFYPKKK